MRWTLAFTLVLAGCGGAAVDDVDPRSGEALVPALQWVGDTHLRYEARYIEPTLVMSGRDLEVYTQTYPAGAAAQVELQWLDDGALRSVAMAFDMSGAGASGNNEQWRATIPGADLVDGAPLAYWIRATDALGNAHYDSRGGANYSVTPQAELALDDAGCWRMAGRGNVARVDGVFRAQPGDGLGLLWCALPTPARYELSLDWRMTRHDDNGGVVLRFRDPETFGYDNTAWVGVHDGLEVQIDEVGRPDAAPWHTTGAIYDERAQQWTRRPARTPGEWNRYVIRVEGQHYEVELNGERATTLDWPGDPSRPERAAAAGARFFGVQSHSGNVEYRAIRLRGL